MRVMIDFEGTLTDNSWRQHLITGFEKNWREYYKGLIDDPPKLHMLIAMKQHLDDGDEVILYTTRMPNKYNMEVEWLKKNNIDIRKGMELYMRENTKTPGPQLLRSWCESLKPDIVIDDRPDNRNAVRDIVDAVLDPQEIIIV